MNENIYTGILVAVALIVIFAVVVLIPQAVGLSVYRLLKSRSGLFAALAGFLVAPLLYAAYIVYFWYLAPPTPTPNVELTGGEGDMVGLAIIFFGLITNIVGGLFLYAYLFAKNRRRAPEKNKSGANDLP